MAVCQLGARSCPFELDSVVTRVSSLSPVVLWLFSRVYNFRDRLDILQPKLHRNQQTERRTMLHGERLSVQVSREQGLRMTSRRQIQRHEVWVGISPATEIDRGFY